jgi:hypothetical protein
MEGGTLVTVNRILSGQPIFARPTMEYTPQIYAPLYYGIASLACRIFGFGFFACGVVSFVSRMASGVIIYAF